MKSRQWIAAVIVVSGIATVGSAVADSRSDGPVAGSTNGLMNSASQVYIYEWARPEWILSSTGASGVAGARYSGRTRAEAKAEMEQARAGGASMNSASRVYIYEWARPEWIGSNMDTGARGVAGARYSGRTRAEVRAELEQARADGLLMTHGDRDDLSVWDQARIGAAGVTGSRYSGRTRAEVRAEAIEHAKKFKSGNDEMYGR
ncbi:MAG: DUF4148 domain-containing protein [Oxalobacteraceae bacterium]|nr:DUF4148 domain-containing protein [Oxalobacteraceae bacterium]